MSFVPFSQGLHVPEGCCRTVQAASGACLWEPCAGIFMQQHRTKTKAARCSWAKILGGVAETPDVI